jgi:hypothetical protein
MIALSFIVSNVFYNHLYTLSLQDYGYALNYRDVETGTALCTRLCT